MFIIDFLSPVSSFTGSSNLGLKENTPVNLTGLISIFELPILFIYLFIFWSGNSIFQGGRGKFFKVHVHVCEARYLAAG